MFYLPTLIYFALVSSRMMFFKFFYELLLMSLLKGWSLEKPNIYLNEMTSTRDWKAMKTEVKDWIGFYQNVVVSIIL
jgi:hypothetical protein